MNRPWCALLALVLLAGCGGAGSGPEFDAGTDADADVEEETGCESCASHDECDDGIACTHSSPRHVPERHRQRSNHLLLALLRTLAIRSKLVNRLS